MKKVSTTVILTVAVMVGTMYATNAFVLEKPDYPKTYESAALVLSTGFTILAWYYVSSIIEKLMDDYEKYKRDKNSQMSRTSKP